MPVLEIFYAPGSCSRATLIALEHAGVAYTPRLIAFMKGDNRQPDFLALNPKGKVPLLLIDGKPLTETVAIMHWLAETFPEAKLLPRPAAAYDRAKIMSDLAWASSALHALIARLRFPIMFTPMAEAHPSLREGAANALADAFRLIDARLADRDWWHGEWSAQDAYLYWVWTRAADAGFTFDNYPHFAAHKRRMDERPSTRAALAIEAKGEAELAARNATLTI